MAVRIKLKDGKPESIETDTPQEAATLYRQLLSPNGASPSSEPSVAARAKKPRPLPEGARRLMEQLYPHPEGVPSQALAKILGIDPKGLGPLVISLGRWARETWGVGTKPILVKERRPDPMGNLVRTLKFADYFRKRIEEEGVLRRP